MHAVIAVHHEKFNCRLKHLKRILNMVTRGRGFSCNNLHSNGYLSLLFSDFFQKHNFPCFFLCLEFHVWNLGSSLRLFAFVCQAPAQKILFLVPKQLCLRSMFAIWQQGAPVSN